MSIENIRDLQQSGAYRRFSSSIGTDIDELLKELDRLYEIRNLARDMLVASGMSEVLASRVLDYHNDQQ